MIKIEIQIVNEYKGNGVELTVERERAEYILLFVDSQNCYLETLLGTYKDGMYSLYNTAGREDELLLKTNSLDELLKTI